MVSDWRDADEYVVFLEDKSDKLEAENEKLRGALLAAEDTIVTLMGVHDYPINSGPGEVLKHVQAVLQEAGDE
jgi:hypothetical protein